MTIETRYVADIADVLAVRLECRKCGAVATRRPDAPARVPEECQNCGQHWFIGSSHDKNMADALFRVLGHFAALQEQPFKLRLELRLPKG